MKGFLKFVAGVAVVGAAVGGAYYFLKKNLFDDNYDDFDDDFDDFDDDFDDDEDEEVSINLEAVEEDDADDAAAAADA
jgi:hypothetical protein